jgi:transcriptional regulator with XRE-family HTH domain
MALPPANLHAIILEERERLMLKVNSEKKADVANLIQQRKRHLAAIAKIDARSEGVGKAPGSKDGDRSDSSSKTILPLRHKLNISQEELARITGYSVRAIASIEAGKTPSKPVARKIREVTRLLTALSQLMPDRKVGEWLRQPNEAFQGRSPIHIIEHGETDQIWEMIHQIDANVAN